MSEAQRKATKGVLQRIADAIKGRPKGGTPDWIPSPSHGNERLPSADPQVRERGTRYQQSEADKAREAAEDAALKRRDERFAAAPKGEKRQWEVDSAIDEFRAEMKKLKPKTGDITADGRMVHVVKDGYTTTHTPADLEKGRGPIPDPNKKGTRIFRPKNYGEGASKDFFDRVAQESKEFYESGAGRTPTPSMQSAMNASAAKTPQQLAEDLASTQRQLGRSSWSVKKDAVRGGQ